MALATPTISVQDGFAAAAVNVNANASAFVTPGNAVTFALQSSTGVIRAEFLIQAPGTLLDGLRSPVFSSTPFSWTVLIPSWFAGTLTINTEVSDGNNITSNVNQIVAYTRSQGNNVHRARNVLVSNVASLAAYAVASAAGNDNVSGGNVQGDIVLAAAQTTTTQNGLYIVGVVSGGNAPLTRVPDFATGNVLPAGQICEVQEGTIFGPSTWKITTAGAITVDTTSHTWMPRISTGTASTGVALTTLWIRATTTPIVTSQLSGAATTGAQSGQTAGITGSSSITITGAGTYLVAALNW